MGKYYIGFDAGTQSVKVVMYSLEMECIAEANYPTFFEYPHPDFPKDDWEHSTNLVQEKPHLPRAGNDG